MSDSVASILKTISPYIEEAIGAGGDSLNYFIDEAGKNLLEETMGRYVADFNQANKGALDTMYRQVKARGGDTSSDATQSLQYQFQTALGRAQAAQMGRKAEQARKDQIHGLVLDSGQKAQAAGAQMGSAVYTADSALEGEKYRSDQSLEGTKYSADASKDATLGAAAANSASRVAAAGMTAGATISAAQLRADTAADDREYQRWYDNQMFEDTDLDREATIDSNNDELAAQSLTFTPTGTGALYYDGSSDGWIFGENPGQPNPGVTLSDWEPDDDIAIQWQRPQQPGPQTSPVVPDAAPEQDQALSMPQIQSGRQN